MPRTISRPAGKLEVNCPVDGRIGLEMNKLDVELIEIGSARWFRQPGTL